MLIEGLVGVVALIAAASLPPRLYYDINVDLDQAREVAGRSSTSSTTKTAAATDGRRTWPRLDQRRRRARDLGKVEEMVGGESLRGRTGGAVTLAVGMAFILTDAFALARPRTSTGVMKYWYHFAIMFEALFILTTIDTGTRIARFLLQEALGKVHPAVRQDRLAARARCSRRRS